ncbi:hypothetical protein FPQ18DRAFT_423305 [Pyronema domesticum]|nr:hypothetical protein FPQ18DRAFT_423305 [Pyronema domesticum]
MLSNLPLKMQQLDILCDILDIYKTPRYGGGELISLGTAECTNVDKLIALLESENYRDSINIDQHLERVIWDILNLFYRSEFGFAKIKLILHHHTQEKPGKHLAGDILLSRMDFLEKEYKRKKKPWSKFKCLLKKVTANLKGKRQQNIALFSVKMERNDNQVHSNALTFRSVIFEDHPVQLSETATMATDMAINMASRVLDNIPELEELQSLSSRMVKHTNSVRISKHALATRKWLSSLSNRFRQKFNSLEKYARRVIRIKILRGKKPYNSDTSDDSDNDSLMQYSAEKKLTTALSAIYQLKQQDSDRFPGYQIILDWLEYLQDVRPGSLIDDDYKFALDQMMSDITEFDGAEGLDELHAQIFEDPDYLKIPDDRHHMELQSMLQVASARARYKTRAEAQAAVVAALQEKLMARRKAKKLPGNVPDVHAKAYWENKEDADYASWLYNPLELRPGSDIPQFRY